jgi:hypothetical protein
MGVACYANDPRDLTTWASDGGDAQGNAEGRPVGETGRPFIV